MASSSDSPLKGLAPHIFAEWIAAQVRHGHRLVPFVGSGFSAASGITIGQKFDSYLAWVVFSCVLQAEDTGPRSSKSDWTDRLSEAERPQTRWNLRKHGWPDFPTSAEVERLKSALEKEFDQRPGGHDPVELVRRPALIRTKSEHWQEDEKILESLWRKHGGHIVPRYLPPPKLSDTSETYVRECAFHALCDWTSALNFLACLRQDEGGISLQLAEEPNQAIIDGFNYFMTHGRKPNLGHNMLCYLADRAGITTILTTNFDSLIEDAFAEMGEHYDVFQVSIKGGLPAPETVYAHNCVVKLHGGLSETRADHSIDHPPTIKDRDYFFRYVCGYDRHVKAASGSERFLPGLLLVCGYSASDLRCVKMIKHVLDADAGIRVAWICHTPGDLKKVELLFGVEYRPTISRGGNFGAIAAANRLIVTQTPRTDLLLFEVFQRLTLALPRGGFSYQFVHGVPPAAPDNAHESTLSENESKLVEQWTEEVDSDTGKIMAVTAQHGLMAPLRGTFEKFSAKFHGQAIWIEMEDYADTIGVAHELLLTIAIRIGRFQLDHVRLLPASEPTDMRDWGYEPAR
ncbi:MAG: SIR2 family protein [Opitutaceae bacterium]|nr:SIR2 family protein [Opitutaceae bacterium]